MKKTVFSAIALVSSIVLTPAFAKETISVVGSNTVTPIMEVFSETYTKLNPEVFIEVQGPGSSAGIMALKKATADIGMLSRSLNDSEKDADLVELPIALDGIAVVVNPQNPVTNLTKEQVTKIYKGKITNWEQVGGNNSPIVIVTRDTASGTRGAFETMLDLKMTIANKTVSAISQRAQVANGNGALKTTIASNKYAIGYISLGTVDTSVKALSIDGVSADIANATNGSYAITRPFLVLYKKGRPSAQAREFLTWMTSENAQKLVVHNGYIAVK